MNTIFALSVLLLAYCVVIAAHYLIIKLENKRKAYDVLQRTQEQTYHATIESYRRDFNKMQSRDEILRERIAWLECPGPVAINVGQDVYADLLADAALVMTDEQRIKHKALLDDEAARTLCLRFADPASMLQYRGIIEREMKRRIGEL